MANKFNRSLAVAFAAANGLALMMNTSEPASAAVVHVESATDLTKKDESIALDLNLDSVLDAYFSQTTTSSKASKGATTKTTTYAVTAVGDTLLTGGGALVAGVLIDDTLSWSSSVTLGQSAKTASTYTYSGDWLTGGSTGTGYLGFSLTLADGVHYGWIEILLDAAAGTTSILSYAYETVAGQAILAGATVSEAATDIPAVPAPAAGALLLGALAAPLAVRRRKRRA